MSVAVPATPVPPASPPDKVKIPIGLIAGVIAMIAVLLLPIADGLPVAGTVCWRSWCLPSLSC